MTEAYQSTENVTVYQTDFSGPERLLVDETGWQNLFEDIYPGTNQMLSINGGLLRRVGAGSGQSGAYTGFAGDHDKFSVRLAVTLPVAHPSGRRGRLVLMASRDGAHCRAEHIRVDPTGYVALFDRGPGEEVGFDLTEGFDLLIEVDRTLGTIRFANGATGESLTPVQTGKSNPVSIRPDLPDHTHIFGIMPEFGSMVADGDRLLTDLRLVVERPAANVLPPYRPPAHQSVGDVMSGTYDAGSPNSEISAAMPANRGYRSDVKLCVDYTDAYNFVRLEYATGDQLAVIAQRGGPDGVNTATPLSLIDPGVGAVQDQDRYHLIRAETGFIVQYRRAGATLFERLVEEHPTIRPPRSTKVGVFANEDGRAVRDVRYGVVETPVQIVSADLGSDGRFQVRFRYSGDPGSIAVEVKVASGVVALPRKNLSEIVYLGDGEGMGYTDALPADVRQQRVVMVASHSSTPSVASAPFRVFVSGPGPVGLNGNAASYSKPTLVLDDWSKHSEQRDNNDIYVPMAGLPASGLIEVEPPYAMLQVVGSHHNMTIAPTGVAGRYAYTTSGASLDNRAILASHQLTAMRTTRDGSSAKFHPDFNAGMWTSAGFRDLGLGLFRWQQQSVRTPLFTSQNRRKTSDVFFGEEYPFETIFDMMGHLNRDNSKRNSFAICEYLATDDYYQEKAAYASSALPASVKLHHEFLNETWNFLFVWPKRLKVEAVRRGLYGNGNAVAFPDVLVVDPQPVDNGIGASPATPAGKTIVYTRGTTGDVNSQGFLWRAKRDVAAGANVEVGPDWELLADNVSVTAGARRFHAMRHLEIIEIYRVAFGSSFTSRVFPTTFLQVGLMPDSLFQEDGSGLFDNEGYRAAVTHVGNSCYISDYLENDPAVTGQRMAQAFRADFEDRLKPYVRQFCEAVFDIGKTPAWYEGAEHPQVDLGAPTDSGQKSRYSAAWKVYKTLPEAEDLARDFSRFMRENGGGPSWTTGMFDPNWAYRNFYSDNVTNAPRYRGFIDAVGENGIGAGQ